MIKLAINLILSFSLLVGEMGQKTDLERKVSLELTNVSLKEAIDYLQTNYGVKFSYVDNMMPLQRKLTLKAKNESLKSVIDGLCDQTSLGYQLINKQIVLKPGSPEPKVETNDSVLHKSREASSKPAPEINESIPKKTPSVFEKEAERPDSLPETEIIEAVVSSEPVIASNESVEASENRRTVGSSFKRKSDRSEEYSAKWQETIEEDTKESEPKTEKEYFWEKWFKPKAPSHDSTAYKVRPFHFGFIYPLSTNGLEAGQYVNNFSMHVLAGYAAGLDGLEFAGLANIEKDYVKGIQFAGIGNLTGHHVDGIQFSGIANISGGDVEGAQFAGILNTTAGISKGAFFAGVGNLTGNYTEGGLFAGVLNMVADSSKTAQFAGVTNINVGPNKGFQAAGVLNVSGDIVGSQIAGAANIAAGDIQGLQLSGGLNIARNVKGSQIGILNIADSVSGASIGILSLVRKGYHHFEIWGGEALHANAALKLGVSSFYNIFALSAILEPDNSGWAFGYGIGSQINIGPKLRMNIDAISYAIFDERNKIRDWDHYNGLNQLKLNFGWELAKHLTLFAGPTFNVQVSDTDLNVEGDLTNSLAPYTFYDESFNNTNVKMWAGFNAGIRF